MIPRLQLRLPGNVHVLSFKTWRHRTSCQGEFSRAPVFTRKPVPGLHGHMERLSLVDISPQPSFNESAMQIEDVDRKRIAFEKTPHFSRYLRTYLPRENTPFSVESGKSSMGGRLFSNGCSEPRSSRPALIRDGRRVCGACRDFLLFHFFTFSNTNTTEILYPLIGTCSKSVIRSTRDFFITGQCSVRITGYRDGHNQRGGRKMKRFGICVLAVLILIVYSAFATDFKLPFYLPIGLAILLSYSYLIATKLPKIYPQPRKAFGQLCLTFLWVDLAQVYELKRLVAKVESGHIEYVRDAAYTHALGTISGMMFLFLLIAYILVRITKWRVSEPSCESETPIIMKDSSSGR